VAEINITPVTAKNKAVETIEILALIIRDLLNGKLTD